MAAIKFGMGKPGQQEELYFLKREKELIENLRRRAHLELVESNAPHEEPLKEPNPIKQK